MASNAALQEEERRFLRGFRAEDYPVFAEIAGRLGLDYFAVDCNMQEDGRILIFEANPAVKLSLTKEGARRPEAKAIVQAAIQMIRERAHKAKAA